MNDAKASFINPKDPGYGVRLTFESTEKCNEEHNYGFVIDIRCEKDAVFPIP